jgi:hypothetical protein
VDELYVEQDHEGHIWKQIARVRLFFLGFLTGSDFDSFLFLRLSLTVRFDLRHARCGAGR